MAQNRKTYKTGESMNHSIPNFIAVSLYKLLENRNKEIGVSYEHEVKAMNYSILMMLNSMIEGFMQDLLKSHLNHIQLNKYWSNRKAPKEVKQGLRLEYALYDNLIKDIEEGTWSKLKKCFKLVFGKSIDEYVGSKIASSIHCQFVLRNMIAHGNTIEVAVLKDEDNNRILEFNKKYDYVFKYLIRNNTIDETIPNNLKLTRIFETNAVDHFVENSILFIEKLADELPEYNRKSMCFHLLKYLESSKEYTMCNKRR